MIGIFDSGVGGMTVAKAVEELLPDYRLVYFGDLARTPYGSKSQETIIKYAIENTEFLLSHGAKIIIIACNSAASIATDILQKRFDLPIFEVITPAIYKAVTATVSGRIGVIGTRATIRSKVYEKKIKQSVPELQVFSQPCPLLVPLVEEGWLSARETKMILRRYLHPLKTKQVDTLVLGCTHYPLLKDLISQRMGQKVTLIDSSEAVAEGLKFFLAGNPPEKNSLKRGGENSYYVSDITEAAQATARKIFNRPITLIKT